jgi:hypothetical protein
MTDDVAGLIQRTRTDQGLPAKIEDEDTLERVAAIFRAASPQQPAEDQTDCSPAA